MYHSMLLTGVFFLKLWLLLSPIIFLWLFYDNTRRRLLKKKYPVGYMVGSWVVFIGFFLFLWMALGSGIEPFLLFLPNTWGSVGENGFFITASNSWALTMGMILTFFISASFDYLHRLRDKVCSHQQILIKTTNKIQDTLRNDDSERNAATLTKLHRELTQYLVDSDQALYVNDVGYIRPEEEARL